MVQVLGNTSTLVPSSLDLGFLTAMKYLPLPHIPTTLMLCPSARRQVILG